MLIAIIALSCLRKWSSYVEPAGPTLCARFSLWRSALCGLTMAALLASTSLAFAAGPKITSVTFAGSNASLTMTISGTGFGTLSGVPCTACSTPFLKIGGHIGCSVTYNIVSWNNSFIIITGLQGNPGGNAVISVTNPQNKSENVAGTSIPSSIRVTSPPKIQAVTFSGSGQNLHMTVTGSGFGLAPPQVPGETDLPNFAFVDQPFGTGGWLAGYGGCGALDAVTLDYLSWSDTRIVISGFGKRYGTGPRAYRKWTVAPGDIVEIAVAHSPLFGLEMGLNTQIQSPDGTGGVWAGRLP